MLQGLLEPFIDPGERTFWLWWVSFAGIALLFTGRRFGRDVIRPFWTASSGLDVQLLVARQLLRVLGWAPLAGGSLLLARAIVGGLHRFGDPDILLPGPVVMGLYTLVLFVGWDLSRYVAHRLMHDIDALWAFHQVHHSAEVLTPLTIHRVHPVESLIYGVRDLLTTGVISGVFFWVFDGAPMAWTVMGVHGAGFVLNGLFGNLRHSHVPVRFGPLEALVISPAQHQLHHRRSGVRVNYGTWLAVWDRMGGTLVGSEALDPDEALGLDEVNHGHDLISAWLGPFRDLGSRWWGVRAQSSSH